MAGIPVENFPCISSISACFILSVVYVSSLYIWNSPHSRDHPTTIKKRFLSVFAMMFVSPLFLYMFSGCDVFDKNTIWELLGLRLPGILVASILPLVLTMILFLGPLAMQGRSGIWRLYAEPMYWVNNMLNLIWMRNHIVAPLSEEFTFRACMLPLLLQCFRPNTAIFICPLFFGTAHFHHMAERLSHGMELKKALLLSCFQFSYTTMFGAYSAYLFVRTGHFIAPFMAHAFCNHMGFPDLSELYTYQEPQRSVIMALCVVGLVLWCLLLDPLTTPSWYSNDVFYKM
ncbi:CAAX prenyl protease 2 [Macrosteles quadrilineatus]|uniref:CAAX prenyl protease 2 n=1 Tax=Macrosteles quadrilineatus TaxID=74068 RepID=UPI0023E2CBF5|nr:CAAX prenyl protease 2 [Macrosteles quadrilineatus]